MKNLSAHLHTPGEIAVIPTDTVYGVVARAQDQKAVERLYQLKQRENKPGTLVAASVEQLLELGIKQANLAGTENFWPGAVSIVIPCDQKLTYLHRGINGLAIRIPDDQKLLKLLDQTGPLLTSSANQPGKPPATTIGEARDYFSDSVDWYENGGVLDGKPSTVIRISGGAIEVLRQGAVELP